MAKGDIIVRIADKETVDAILTAVTQPTYEECIMFLADSDMLVAVEDGDGGILTDENGNVLIW